VLPVVQLSAAAPVGPSSLGRRPNTLSGGVLSGSLAVAQVNDVRDPPPRGLAWSRAPASPRSPPSPAPLKRCLPDGSASPPGRSRRLASQLISPIVRVTSPASLPPSLTPKSPDNSATWSATIAVTVPG